MSLYQNEPRLFETGATAPQHEETPPDVKLSGRFARYTVILGIATAAFFLGIITIIEVLSPRLPLLMKIGVVAGLSLPCFTLLVLIARSVGNDIDNMVADITRSIPTPEQPDAVSWRLRGKVSQWRPELVFRANAALAAIERRQKELERLAYEDMLTGLPNRLGLERAMLAALPSVTDAYPAALILLDIDGFERIQDVVGPADARAIIYEVSRRLGRETVGEGEDDLNQSGGHPVLARIGGESFALFLRGGYSREQVASLAESLRRVAREPVERADKMFTLNLSGGIAMAPDDGTTTDELLRHAELALREVHSTKSSGFRFFTPRLDRLARGRIRFEAELREAVERGEFRAVFQPKVEFASGRVVGAEALARWQRPNGKSISPGTFIPVAEEMGLIGAIGSQILKQSCIEAYRWLEAGHDCSVAVNVSPLQFESDQFVTEVVDSLCASGLPPTRLELEITETLAVDSPKRVSEIMRPLRSMGVGLAIDDFGSGHANLSILTQLPFDVFKIDRQFVMALQQDRQAPAIVEMILAMAETLGLKTVAEGVETAQQADFLRRRGCTMAQGFLYSPPVSGQDFLAMLNEHRQLGPRRKSANG